MNGGGNRGGFTLIEVMVATIILSLGLAVLLTSFANCQRVMKASQDYETAQYVLTLGETVYPIPSPDLVTGDPIDDEQLNIQDIGGEWYITSDHEMTKQHYISFAAYVSDSSATIFRQYPEWSLQIHLPMCRSGRLVWYCAKCGLLYQDIRPARR